MIETLFAACSIILSFYRLMILCCSTRVRVEWDVPPLALFLLTSITVCRGGPR